MFKYTFANDIYVIQALTHDYNYLQKWQLQYWVFKKLVWLVKKVQFPFKIWKKDKMNNGVFRKGYEQMDECRCQCGSDEVGDDFSK